MFRQACPEETRRAQHERLKVILDPPGDPAANMTMDESLVQQVRSGVAPFILRVYRWNQPAISLGRCQDPQDLPADLTARGWPLVRRPTGGGAVLHRLDEVTYALAISSRQIPAGVPLRRIPCLLHGTLRDLLIREGIVSAEELRIVPAGAAGPAPLCFSAPMEGDLLYRGVKVAGAALRVWRDALLLQGSLQGLPLEFIVISGLLVQAAEIVKPALYAEEKRQPVLVHAAISSPRVSLRSS